ISSDKILRIGIDVDNEGLSSQEVKSSSNVSFYILANRSEMKLLDLNEKNVTFQKSNYHIRVSENLLTEKAMMEKLSSYKAIDSSVYPVYSGGWYIAYGSYTDESDGIGALLNAKKKFAYDKASLYYSNKLIDIVGTKKLVSYNVDDGDFFVKEDTEKSVLSINGKSYRNGISVIFSPNSNFTIVNIVPIDDYLYGVLPKEMNGIWHIEALKAQAVAARNFALVNIDKYKKYGYDLSATTNSQVYGGLDVEEDGSNLAVDLTRGSVLVYEDKLVAAYYHSNSGGRTESSENVWSSKLPYLRGVLDEYSMFQPNYTWEKSYTAIEVSAILFEAGYYVGSLKDIRINEVSENNRVQSVSFIGDSEIITLEKEKIRAVFGYSDIKSIWYTIDKGGNVALKSATNISTRPASNMTVLTKDGIKKIDASSANVYDGNTISKVYVSKSTSNDVFVFKGYGYGHGLGMSQYGAKIMAEKGFTYEEILTHYFSETKLINTLN
ncbi:MAG: SpoIID/LytB domain-containing protein, partial [Acidaminobacteraceae bacterium]